MKAIEFEQHDVDFAKHRVARGLGIDVDEDRLHDAPYDVELNVSKMVL